MIVGKKVLIGTTALVLALPAAAQGTAQHYGNMTYFSDGTSAQRSGNMTYYSSGNSAQRSGNMTYFSDGSSAQRSGNSTYYYR